MNKTHLSKLAAVSMALGVPVNRMAQGALVRQAIEEQNRVRSPAELARIEKARVRRERKAQRKKAPNEHRPR